MTEYLSYINFINNYNKLQKLENINFDLLFNSLMDYCMKFNSDNFGKNYSSSKCFVHIWGGASIKYKMNMYGLNIDRITSDIDIIIIPFENNPDIRIKLIEEFTNGLKKELPNFMWTHKIGNLITRLYLNENKIIDIVFYDNINPWYKDYQQTDIFTSVIRNLYKFKSVDEYFIHLKKLFESELIDNQKLQKVTFTSIEFDYQSLKLLIELYNYKYINEIKKMKEKNVPDKEIYNMKKLIKNKIRKYRKKLFYITHMMIYNI